MEASAPTPIFAKPNEEKLKAIEEYPIYLSKQEFKIHLSKYETKIIIKIEEINNINSFYYESDFSLDDLKNVSKLFRIFDSINEVFDSINEIFKNKKASINIESKEGIILHLNIYSFASSKTEDISLTIKKKFLKKEKLDEIILKEIKQIKENALNDRLNLKKKINLLEQSLNEEKQKNINLQKIVDGLIKENNEIKNSFNEIIMWKKMQEEKYNIDSKILINKEDIKLLINRLKKSELCKNNIATFSLVYRASRDGDDPLNYYDKCIGKKNTLCIIETKKGCKFGGYTETLMDFSKGNLIDPNSFVFSLNKKKIYENLKKEKAAVDHCKGWGPIFRNDAFAVWNSKFFSFNENTVGSKSSSNFGVMDEDYEINNGESNFSIKELEVFQINY